MNPKIPNPLQARKENCRQQVREFLTDRKSVALDLHTIRRGVNKEVVNDFTIDEIADAAAFLWHDGQVKEIPSNVGATIYYQITGKGILAHERREVFTE